MKLRRPRRMRRVKLHICASAEYKRLRADGEEVALCDQLPEQLQLARRPETPSQAARSS